jgi:hypothetical protein
VPIGARRYGRGRSEWCSGANGWILPAISASRLSAAGERQR